MQEAEPEMDHFTHSLSFLAQAIALKLIAQAVHPARASF